MNEIELLRNQLATERLHVREVASACAAALAAGPQAQGDAALETLRGACGDYLALVLDWFDRRDARLGELYAQRPPADAGRTALAALDLAGRGREALEEMTALGPARESWQALARFIHGPWDERRGAVEALLASNQRVADWRVFGGIDADSVCQERALYARVRAALPSGSALGPA
jgi:hypothetical protein